jgi:glutamate racemase
LDNRQKNKNKNKKKAAHRFFLTDVPGSFHHLAERFLGEKVNKVKQVVV